MSKLITIVLLINLLSTNACKDLNKDYEKIYYKTDIIIRNTNNLCNGIENHSLKTNHLCKLRKVVELNNFPMPFFPNNGCVQLSKAVELNKILEEYKSLNNNICSELKTNNYDLKPDLLDKNCQKFGSISHLIRAGLTLAFWTPFFL